MAVTLPYRARSPRRETTANNPADVAEVQEYLRKVSFADNRISRIAVDGIYGSKTSRAVAAFQSGHGLAQTGRVDKTTWDALYVAYQAETARQTPPAGLNPFPGADVALGPGEGGDATVLLQLMLASLSRRFSNIPALSVTGQYDAATQSAVASFQRAAGFEITGRTDKAIWNLLVKTYESYRQADD